MLCEKCGVDNWDGRDHCGRCGQPLKRPTVRAKQIPPASPSRAARTPDRKKSPAAIAIAAIVALLLVIAAVPAARDEIHWRWASYHEQLGDYDAYLKTWPQGSHVGEAKERYDDRAWSDAQAANTVEAFERYLKLAGESRRGTEAKDHIDDLRWKQARSADNVQAYERYLQLQASGRSAPEARDRIESLQWQQASTANTIRGYRDYVAAHPEGRHVADANLKAAALRTDAAPYELALRTGGETGLKRFLEDYPGHEKEALAHQALLEITEGRDIVDLVAEKKIEIKARGSGIQSVSVEIRKRVPHSLTVRVPVGSYFVSARASAQNMVTTAEGRVRLTHDDWHRISVPAACANRPRDIPGDGDTFTVQRSPKQQDLVRLMPVLDKARVGFATRQAAVWIVTDDASYDELGILVSRSAYTPFGRGSRMIGAREAAHAMRICEEAGIRMSRKSIWEDREEILEALPDGELKSWLREKK